MYDIKRNEKVSGFYDGMTSNMVKWWLEKYAIKLLYKHTHIYIHTYINTLGYCINGDATSPVEMQRFGTLHAVYLTYS